ncbi:hypothetical protein BE11_42960 [Sorangium cellulosum]|nr:hypothetical protein BE11_42960 [Sorangium cellulosum]
MTRRSKADLAAHRHLDAVLRDLDDDGVRVPCAGSDKPISEDEEERAFVATAWCPSCPALTACSAAGAFHRFGVWGVDRTARTYAPRTKETNR